MKRIQRIALAVFSLAIVLGPTAPAMAAMVPGGAVGPVVPSGLGKGFPAWYMDQNGLALDLMEAADSMGISDPVNPANSFSQELGFNAEGFWWATDAAITNTSIDALMVLAVEAAFAGEAAVDGEQSAFGRVKFVIDVPAAGTYTVTHPYGTETFVVDAVVPGPEIRSVADIGCFATAGVTSCDPNSPPGNLNNFSIALQSGVGPFLTWDTFNLNPALTDPLLVNSAMPGKRYVGNPSVEHTIKGSPVGQNFFRIEGPAGADLNPALTGIQDVIETNLFTVAGRVAVIDTAAPTISAAPMTTTLGSTNVVASVDMADDLGVRSATIDIGALGNTFSSTLNGAQEVPATASSATGNGSFTIDTVANTLSFNITTSGLTGGAETGAHIHGPAAAGVNAPILFELPLGSSKSGTWTYPEASEADILAGTMYVNVHTTLFPNGEIRGQILPQSNVQNMILTAGTQTDGTWGAVIPTVDRLGSFTLPIVVTDGSNVTNSALVLSVVPVLDSVTVSPTASDLLVGATEQLGAAGFDPSGAPITSGLSATWSSDNPLVASVSAGGLVTALSAGTTTITATITNGVNTLSVTVPVTVSPAVTACQTMADTDADSIISNLEILNYVRSWKSGTVSNLLILRAIGFWKAGTGC